MSMPYALTSSILMGRAPQHARMTTGGTSHSHQSNKPSKVPKTKETIKSPESSPEPEIKEELYCILKHEDVVCKRKFEAKVVYTYVSVYVYV